MKKGKSKMETRMNNEIENENISNSVPTPREKEKSTVSADGEGSGFNYAYSAKRQSEVERIKSKYMPKKEDKMETLLRLDRTVTKNASLASIIVGAIGSLLLGCGMSLIMTDIAKALNMSFIVAMIVGVSVGILGIALIALAYPLYKVVLRHEREKHASKILSIAAELEKNN